MKGIYTKDGVSGILHNSREEDSRGLFFDSATDSVTRTVRNEVLEGLVILNTENQYPYELAKINDRKGDLSKRWVVSFKVWNSFEGKLERKQIFISQKIKSKQERNKEAKALMREINKLLASGHVIGEKLDKPQKSKKYFTLLEAFRWVQDNRDGEIRKKSVQTVSIILTEMEEYLSEHRKGKFPLEMVSRDFCENFMLWVKKKRAICNNTYNNYLNYFKGYFFYLVEKDVIKHNPAEKLKPLPKTEPNRYAFPENVKARLLDGYNQCPQLAIFSKYIYYTFIRPKELRQLQVKNLLEDTIFIPGHISKNRKSEHVLITPGLRKMIDELDIRKHPPSYYLIGKDGMPSRNMVPTNYFSTLHLEVRKKLELDPIYKLYCWKHTGAVDMYKATKDIEFVSRHCRHSSLDMTKRYLRSLGLMMDYQLMGQLPTLDL